MMEWITVPALRALWNLLGAPCLIAGLVAAATYLTVRLTLTDTD